MPSQGWHESRRRRPLMVKTVLGILRGLVLSAAFLGILAILVFGYNDTRTTNACTPVTSSTGHELVVKSDDRVYSKVHICVTTREVVPMIQPLFSRGRPSVPNITRETDLVYEPVKNKI